MIDQTSNRVYNAIEALSAMSNIILQLTLK